MSTHESFQFGHQSGAHYTLTSPRGRIVDVSFHLPQGMTEKKADSMMDVLLAEYRDQLFALVDSADDFADHERADLRVYQPGKYTSQKEPIDQYRLYLNIPGSHQESLAAYQGTDIQYVSLALNQAFQKWTEKALELSKQTA